MSKSIDYRELSLFHHESKFKIYNARAKFDKDLAFSSLDPGSA